MEEEMIEGSVWVHNNDTSEYPSHYCLFWKGAVNCRLRKMDGTIVTMRKNKLLSDYWEVMEAIKPFEIDVPKDTDLGKAIVELEKENHKPLTDDEFVPYGWKGDILSDGGVELLSSPGEGYYWELAEVDGVHGAYRRKEKSFACAITDAFRKQGEKIGEMLWNTSSTTNPNGMFHYIEENILLKDMRKTFEDCMQTAIAKNSDYGGSNNDPYANFRNSTIAGVSVEKGIMVRMMDKISRISTLMEKEAQVKDEDIEDTLMDLINYAAILKSYLKNK